MLVPDQHVDEHGEQLVHHAHHRVCSSRHDRLALEARPRDPETSHAREREQAEGLQRPIRGSEGFKVARDDADEGGGRDGEGVRVEDRRPDGLQAEARDEGLAVRELKDEQHEPYCHPRVCSLLRLALRQRLP